MCRQPAIWPPTTKCLPLTSHLSDLYSGWRPLHFRPLLPITIVSLPTTQKHFDWADVTFHVWNLIRFRTIKKVICIALLVLLFFMYSDTELF